jgi:hypothetical protein
LGTELQGINNEIRKENTRSEDLIAMKRKLENEKLNLENRR